MGYSPCFFYAKKNIFQVHGPNSEQWCQSDFHTGAASAQFASFLFNIFQKISFEHFLTIFPFPFQCLIFHQILFPLFKKHHQKIDEQVSVFQTSPYFSFFEPGWLFKFSFELMVLVNRNASLRLWGTIQGFLKNKNFNDHLINCYIHNV